MLSIMNADLPKIRITSNTGLPTLRSYSMMAMRQYVIMQRESVFGRHFMIPPKPFDLKVLLNPFIQLHLPAIFVK